MVSEDEGGEEILDKYFCFGQTAVSCCLDEMATQVFLHLSIGGPSLKQEPLVWESPMFTKGGFGRVAQKRVIL